VPDQASRANPALERPDFGAVAAVVMTSFDATARRFALMIGLMAILILFVTVVIVVYSLSRMAGEVNRIEDAVTEKSAVAAVRSDLRRLGETHNDYAQWDDAVRILYGSLDAGWFVDNIATSSLFDTVFVVDEDGKELLGYRGGEPLSLSPSEVFGPSLAAMIAELPTDGTTYDVRTGIVKSEEGLFAVAVGPIVPVFPDFPNPPPRSRYLVIGQPFDETAVHRLAEDYLIDGLRLVDPAAAAPLKIDLVDPDGAVVAALAWAPGRVGNVAYAGVSPAVLAALLLVGLTMVFLMAVALRGWREVRKRELRLDAALTNMSQGLCMFDAEGRLVIANPRFAEIYRTPPKIFKPGMTIADMLAEGPGPEDVDPEGTLAQAQQYIARNEPASMVQRLTDGRSVAINYRPIPDRGFVATFEDITERRIAEERIRHLAHHDALTDLLNRAAFYERMEDALAHRRRAESIGVLSLDLDHFKSVNDTLGHPVGDLLLQTAADRMRSCVRGDDILARLGGDEFAIVQVPSDQPQDVSALAGRLIEVVGKPYFLDGHQVVVGVSIGIALAPADGDQPDKLMKNADLALYRAKADGGGLYRFFQIEMDARMQARRAIELDLRKAIVNREFALDYQPIIDVKSGQITSCEALVRWLHPERGLIPPLDFIPVAEATGAIVPLGEWIIRQACADAASWPAGVTVAVNLSPAQFKSRDLVSTVVDALKTSGLTPDRLELEITELVLLQETDGAFAILHQLRNLGIRIAMDDFGTGYSSLGYLRAFPFDKIKIDESFIRDLPNKEDSLAIVRAVVGLGSSLGIRITAEGVETREQLESVTAEGCSEFQGFLFSHPRPAADIVVLLKTGHPGAMASAPLTPAPG
jgi:diguanylate cyclase (GGDEF)-like protein